MATAGWYPDPSGQAGAFRYWDGQAWGSELSDNPYAPPPGSAPAPAPDPFDQPTVFPGSQPVQPADDATSVAPPAQPYDGGYGRQPGPQVPQQSPGAWAPTPAQPPQHPVYQPTPQQQSWPAQPGPAAYGHTGSSTTGSRSGSGPGKAVGLALLAVLMVLLLGVATFFVVRAVMDDDERRTATDDSSRSEEPGDEPSSAETAEDPSEEPSEEPTDEPTEEPSEEPVEEPVDPFLDPATPEEQQCQGGKPARGAGGVQGGVQRGGGLSMPEVDGFAKGPDQSAAFVFADGVTAPSRVVEQNARAGWVAVHALGGLPKDSGFTDPGQAASVVLECMARSETFYQGFTGGEVTDSRAVEVDGADGWLMEAEVRIDNPDLEVEGDVASVLVVDTGDPATYGLYVSVTPIGNDRLLEQARAQRELLELD